MTTMQTGETKMRFGRCPHCRAMIYQNTSAAIYYCSKCRTPIRGKNTGATDEADQAGSRVEILSASDTASVISDELGASCTQASVTDVDGDQPPSLSSHDSCHSSIDGDSDEIGASSPSPGRGSSSARACMSGSNGFPRGFDDGQIFWNDKAGVRSLNTPRGNGLRPSSRRTRQASSNSDPSILRSDLLFADSVEGSHTPRTTRHRRSLLSTSAAMSGPEGSTLAVSPLTDPAFQRDLLDALDNLRSMIDAIELQPPPPASSGRSVTRRDLRRLESKLAQALSRDAEEHAPPARNASTVSSSSSNGRGEQPALSRTQHCLPVLGGAPFVVCGNCSELLQTPASTARSRRRAGTRLRCGGCEELLELTLPAATAAAGHAEPTSSACSAPRASGSCHGSGELDGAASGSGVAQEAPVLLLHRALGYSSPISFLRSRRRL